VDEVKVDENGVKEAPKCPMPLSKEKITTPAPECPKGIEIIAYRMSDAGWTIEPAASNRDWQVETKGHANKCLPLLVGNQLGYVIRNPTEVTAIWNGGSQPEDIKIIHEDATYKKTSSSHFGHGIITWQIPFLFRTPPGIGLMVRGATNFWVEGAQALDAFVETHWSPYTFTMNWKIIKPDVPVIWKKGDPICMIIPYPVEFLENIVPRCIPIADNPELELTYRSWSDYRDRFNMTHDRKESWQKDYFKGKKCPFHRGPENIAEPHRTKFKLPPFKYE